MSDYTTSALLAVFQIILWLLILFVWLPRRLFPIASSKPVAYHAFDNVVRMAFASIIIVHLLAFLNIFDLFSLIFAFILLYFGYQAWICKVPLWFRAQQVWKSWLITFYDILDGRVLLSGYLKTTLNRFWRGSARNLPTGVDLGWVIAYLMVLMTSAFLRLVPAIQEPAPASADAYPHEIWLKGLGLNRLFPDGLYPYGGYALLQVIHQFTAVDETVLLRLAPGLAGVLLAAAIHWSVARLTGRRGPALLAAALYGIFGFSGWLPLPLPLQGDVLTVEIALIFVLPAFVFLVEALAGDGQQPSSEVTTGSDNAPAPPPPGPAAPQLSHPSGAWLYFQAMACLFFVQPFVGAVVFLAVLAALVVIAVLQLKVGQAIRLINRGLWGALVGLSPLLIGWAQGKQLHLGPLRWDTLFFGATLREGRFLPPPPAAPGITWLLTLGLLGAVILLLLSLWRGAFERHLRTAWQLFGIALLGLLVLYQPAIFGLGEYLLPYQVARVLTPVLVVVIGLCLHFIWIVLAALVYRTAGAAPNFSTTANPTAKAVELAVAVALILALLIPFPSILIPPPALAVAEAPKQEYESASRQIFRIKKEIPATQWTVVSYNEAYPHVIGQGFFVNNEDFLESYQPESWRFDPRRPELAIPSPHVFIFIEKQPFITSGQSAAEAIKRDAIRRRLQDWVDRYQTLRSDMSLFYDDGLISVYHIYRTPAEEERILTAIERGLLPLNIPPPAATQPPGALTQTTTLPPPSLDTTPVITYQAQRGDLVVLVEFEGQIAPAAQQPLFFQSDGRVSQVNVAAGEAVTTGQVLAQLETQSLQRALEAAKTDLALIEANIAAAGSVAGGQVWQAQLEVEIANLNLQASQVGLGGPELTITETAPALERAFKARTQAENNFNAIQQALDTPPGHNEALKRVWLDPWVWNVFEKATTLEKATENTLQDRLFYDHALQNQAKHTFQVSIAERRVEQARLRVEALGAGVDPTLENDAQRARLLVERLQADLAEAQEAALTPNQNLEAVALQSQRVKDIEQQLAEAQIDLKQAEANLAAAKSALTADAQQAEIDLWMAQIELEQLIAQEADLRFAELQSKTFLDRSEGVLIKAQAKYNEVTKDFKQPAELQALHQANMDFIRAKVAHDRATQSVNPHEVLLRQHEVEQAQQNLARVQSQQTLTFNVERERALLTIQQLEAQLAATQLVSPLDGNVLALNLTPGREVAAFQPVGLVADLNQLEVVAEQIPPQTILALREGMPAVVTNRIASAEQPGTPGHIRQVPAPSLTALLPDFEEETQNIDNAVRVALDTPAVTAGYQVGDRVRVTVEMERRENVLWLPPQAIRAANNGEYFVVITGQRVPVEIGLQTPGQVEIKQGLTEGQLVDGP